MTTFTAIKHGYREVLTGTNPTDLVPRYDVLVWTNDGSPKPVVVASRPTQRLALLEGKRWVDMGGRIAKYGVLGDTCIPLMI